MFVVFVRVYASKVSTNRAQSPLLSHRTCPKGVDPYPNIVGVDEEQLIDCYCPGDCSGSLRLAFRGHSTRPIPFDSSAALVKFRLEVRPNSSAFCVFIKCGYLSHTGGWTHFEPG